MKLKISLIVLILATFLCNAQDDKLNSSQLKELQSQKFNLNGVKLFPNPSSDEISIEFKAQVLNLNLEIIDTRGRLMFKNKSENTSLKKINISTFPQGVYFIRIYSETVEDFLKFVKN